MVVRQRLTDRSGFCPTLTAEHLAQQGVDMALSYLIAAVLSGLTGAVLWIGSGGSVLSGLGVYVLTGNLSVAALLARHYLNDAGPRSRF
tara:strand:+ start:311 stop:577 length:267 start_codon:yes stop_codon:yes gene_type:complete